MNDESKFEESEDYDENEMEEGVPPKEDLDFFKELNDYYSPFAHLVGSRLQNKLRNAKAKGVEIDFDGHNGSFGKNNQNNDKLIFNSNFQKPSSKNKSLHFEFKLKPEGPTLNKNKSTGLKNTLRPPEINLSMNTNPIFSEVIDLIYDSLMALEGQVRDLFRSEERKQSFISVKNTNERSKIDKRKTIVLSNVPHFNVK